MNLSNIFSSHPTDYVIEKALHRERISKEEALRLYEEADCLKLQAAGRAIREQKTKASEVSYTVFQVVNYSTFCNVDCHFCSYYKAYDSPLGKRLSPEEIISKMRNGQKSGAKQMFLQGGVDEKLPFDYYLEVLQKVRAEFGPELHIRAFSPVELINMESMTKFSLRKVLRLLKEAGMNSVPGAGAEILTERMRNILSPKKASVEEWLRVMRLCHEEGLYGSANIVFGSEEKKEEIIEHLALVRSLQDQTGGFLSFIPWTFQQQTKKFRTRSVSGMEFLKVLALCRIFLDNIPHIETSLMVLGKSLGSLALLSGSDDISSVVLEENVLRSHGTRSEEEACAFIKENAFTPVRRDLLYNYQREV